MEFELKVFSPPSSEQIQKALDVYFQNSPEKLKEALRTGSVQIRVKKGQILVIS